MNSFRKRTISMVLLLAFLVSLVPPSPAAAQAAQSDSMEEAYLLMIAANARLLKDPADYPAETSSSGSGARQASPASPPPQVTRKQINEQRVMSQYYMRMAANLPAGHPEVKTLLARAYAHSELGDVLQRRRNRENNPFQKIGRAIIRPFKFIAAQLKLLVRQAIKLLEEVGPDIILEMVQNYLTTGTPINIKIFFQKYKEIAIDRMRASLNNKAIALLTGQPLRARSVARVTATTLKTVRVTRPAASATPDETGQTPTAETTNTPEGPKKYGKFTVSIPNDAVNDGALVSRRYFDHMLTKRNECAYYDFQVYNFSGVNLPLEIDLDKGTFSLNFTGSGTDYMEANDITIDGWDFSATFDGKTQTGTVQPLEDKSGWLLTGSVDITSAISGKNRCVYYPPNFPYQDMEYVWFNTEHNLTVQPDLHAVITNRQALDKDKKVVYIPGGTIDLDIGLADAEADKGDYFVLIVNDAPIPPAFPPP